MTFASRPANQENLRLRNDSRNEFFTRSNVNQQRVSHSFRRGPRSFQIRSPTSFTLVPTSSALVPNSPPTSLTLVSTSFALVPDSQLTVTINRGQATTMPSEHHSKDQRKRTQRRSAAMFDVFSLCVLRATFVHARTRRWAVRHIMRQCTTMTEKRCFASMACGWCVAQTLLLHYR